MTYRHFTYEQQRELAMRRKCRIASGLFVLCMLALIGLCLFGCKAAPKLSMPVEPTAANVVTVEPIHEEIVVPFAYDSVVPIILPAVFDRDYDLIVFEGHADARGSDAYNDDLSLRRIESVYNAMEALGVSGEARVEAYGESRPLCYDTTEECHARNRRVVIKTKKEVISQ